MLGIEIAAIDHILLRDAHQHVVQRNQLCRGLRLHLLQVVAEARFRGAPVRHGVAANLACSLVLGLVPIQFRRRVALDVESLLVAFAQPRIEDELRHAARVAHALRLVKSHVVRHAVLRLAGGKGLQEHGAAILKTIENRAVQLGRVGHGNLRHERRTVAGKEGLRNRLLLGVLALRGRAKHVHVVAAQHWGRVGVLSAGIRVHLRIQHQRLHVRAVLQDDLGHVLVADVAHAAIAAHHPNLGQLNDFLVGHQRIGKVRQVIVLFLVNHVRVASQDDVGNALRQHRAPRVVHDEAFAHQPAHRDAILEERVHPRIGMRVVGRG